MPLDRHGYYGSIARLQGSAMAVDTQHVAQVFGVRLLSVADHIAGWRA